MAISITNMFGVVFKMYQPVGGFNNTTWYGVNIEILDSGQRISKGDVHGINFDIPKNWIAV